MAALAVFKPCPQNKIHTYIKTLGWDWGNLRTEHTKTTGPGHLIKYHYFHNSNQSVHYIGIVIYIVIC